MNIKLQSVGIESNYVNQVWSGVSLERYKNIIRKLNNDLVENSSHNHNNSDNNCEIFPKYSLFVILLYLWESSQSKKCLLDFLLSIEKSSGKLLINDNYSFLRSETSIQKNEWIESKYDPNLSYTKEIIEKSAYIIREFVHNPGFFFFSIYFFFTL